MTFSVSRAVDVNFVGVFQVAESKVLLAGGVRLAWSLVVSQR